MIIWPIDITTSYENIYIGPEDEDGKLFPPPPYVMINYRFEHFKKNQFKLLLQLINEFMQRNNCYIKNPFVFMRTLNFILKS